MENSSISLWDSSAQEHAPESCFLAESSVDVAVVGGGYTGLSTALHCAEQGLNVQLVEAQQIGYGGSGRNCGLVNAALWLPPQVVRKRLGQDYGPRFIERFAKGPEYVFDLIEKHQIRCEKRHTGTVHAAHSQRGLKDLQGRATEWQRLNEPVELLNRQQVSDMVGTDAYCGGLLDHRAGTINPMAYCRGLARAAHGAGATIGIGVRANRLEKEAGKWRLFTNQGSLLAQHVVLGTNAYTDGLWPGLDRIFTIVNYFQLATKPLDDDAGYILPGGQGLWDTNPIMFNFRRDAFNRLLVGSMGKVQGTVDSGLSRRWAIKRIKRLFPSLPEVEFDHAWDGQIAMTPDHLPRIMEMEKNLFTAIGYNGRGITTGTLFGKALAQLVRGTHKSELPLPMTESKPAFAAPLFKNLYQFVFTGNQFIKSVY
ncbi:MAG: FAD-binding oxidoreductase [Granulosicoccus sp.]|nr:FAD-binding oxidoreductase [Granulosicoccus sp.]